MLPICMFGVSSDRFGDSNFSHFTLEHFIQVTNYKIFALAPFNCKYITRHLMVIVVIALSITIYEIYANQINGHKYEIVNEGQGQDG